MEIILSIVVMILKFLNYLDVILQKFGIKMYSITKESLLQGLSSNILIFILKSSYFIYVLNEVDFRHVCQTQAYLSEIHQNLLLPFHRKWSSDNYDFRRMSTFQKFIKTYFTISP